jgi:hypothetical protein
MALEQEELRRRLAAARELVGLDQAKMGAELKRRGLGKTDAKRLERGTLPFSESHLIAYARITELPEAWFTTKDWRSLISATAAADASPEVAELTAQRSALLTTIARVRTELEDLRSLQPPGGNS